ncbi:MAG: hypothetical protein JJU45_00045 [Acidimicrobiia bacterium]|nr:hypothetical protein [Acidimicrobiia bacterium]
MSGRSTALQAARTVGHDIVAVGPALVTARVLVAMAWWFSGALAGPLHDAAPPRVHREGLLAWDGTWYEAIAALGYGNIPDEALRFFPLYPLVARWLAAPFGGDVAWTLVVVANVSAVAVAVAVLRLARLEGVSEAAARRAACFVSLFPAGFVLVWAYSEALFLVAAVGTFLGARSQRWGLAATCAFAAAATRPLGLLLVAPLAVEALRWWRPSDVAHRLASAAAVVAPLAGTGAYLAWVGWRFGDALSPFTVQGDFRGDAVNPLVRIGRGLGDLVGPERFGEGLHVPFAVAFVVLAVLTFRRWPLSYGLYAAAVLVVALAADNLNSLQRYALNAFPLAMTFGVLLHTERWERLGLAVSACGLFSLATLAWMAIYVP